MAKYKILLRSLLAITVMCSLSVSYPVTSAVRIQNLTKVTTLKDGDVLVIGPASGDRAKGITKANFEANILGGIPVTSEVFGFSSINERDTYFSANLSLLTTDMVVIVNDPVGVTSFFYWTGLTAPTTFDAALFVGASVNSTPGTLFLGKDGTQISSAAKIFNFITAYGETALPVGTFFTDDGSVSLIGFEFTKVNTIPVNDVFDTQLTVPQELLFPATAPFFTYVDEYLIRPAQAGTLRVKAYAGNSVNDPVVIDSRFEITAGQVGSIVTLQLPNGLLGAPGDEQLVVFEDLTLFGGLQTTGIFTGQTKVFFSTTIAVLESVKYLDRRDLDNYAFLNSRYTTAVAKTGGLVVNTLPAIPIDTYINALFTPGVAATSNPTIITVGSGTFTTSDLITFVTSFGNPDSNDEIYEVLSHVGNTLTIRGVGVTAKVEDFTENNFIDQISTGVITKVNVSVLRADTNGDWEVGKGSSTPLVYSVLEAQTPFTQGSVPFAAASGDLTEDNPNFFWDDVNKRLRIGPAPAVSTVHISENTTGFGAAEGLTIEHTNLSGAALLHFKDRFATFTVGTDFDDNSFYITPGLFINTNLGLNIDRTTGFTSLGNVTGGPYQLNVAGPTNVIGKTTLRDDFSVDTSLIFADVSNGTVTIGNNVTGTDRFNVFGGGFSNLQTGIAAFYNSAGDLKFRLRDEFTANSIPPRIEANSSLGLAFNTVTDAPFIWYVNGTANEKMRLTSTGLAVTGITTATSFNGVPLTTGGVATNFLDETGNYIVPSGSPAAKTNAEILTTLSPDDGLTFYSTDDKFNYQFDTSRSKWLSSNDTTYQFGSNGTTDNNELRFNQTQNSISGVLLPRNGTVISVTGTQNGGNTTKGFEVRSEGVNIFSYTLVASEFISNVVNADFLAGDMMHVFAIAAGGATNNPTATVTIKWRL